MAELGADRLIASTHRRTTTRCCLLAAAFASGLGLAGGAYAAGNAAASGSGAATAPPPVSLTINPDGTAVWNGEPLAGVPDLKDKLAHRTLQDPKLELDLHFHSVPELSDSNRQTLLDILELAARFGYVHVETSNGGARLTVLGPTAVKSAPK